MFEKSLWLKMSTGARAFFVGSIVVTGLIFYGVNSYSEQEKQVKSEFFSNKSWKSFVKIEKNRKLEETRKYFCWNRTARRKASIEHGTISETIAARTAIETRRESRINFLCFSIERRNFEIKTKLEKFSINLQIDDRRARKKKKIHRFRIHKQKKKFSKSRRKIEKFCCCCFQRKKEIRHRRLCSLTTWKKIENDRPRKFFS